MYSNTNKEVRTKLREDKEKWINQQCETLETEITRNNTKKAFDIVKKLTRGHTAKATIIEDKNGNTLTEKSKVVDRWREYCKELYNYKGDVDGSILNRLANEQDQEEDPPITVDEVIEAV